MSDWIDVPVIEIQDGWTVDDIQTEDDCDDAMAVLTKALAACETRVDELEALGQKGTETHIRVKSALRWKKAALAMVQIKRGRINREKTRALSAEVERRILAYITAAHPLVMSEALQAMRASGTEVKP